MPAQQLALLFDTPSTPSTTQLRMVNEAVATPLSTGASQLTTAATHASQLATLDPEQGRRELERFLRLSLGMRVHLTITDNRRNLFSWRRQIDHVTLRLHHMFLNASADAKQALADYMGGKRARLKDIRRYIHDNMHQVRPVETSTSERTDGVHHDLRAIYDALNARYFDAKCDATIAWGKLPPRRRRRRTSMRLGSYTLGDAAIRIHPLLDDHRVPMFFVASVVHHEMLHHMVPAREVNGRLQYHSPEFRRREREFEHFELAARWEKEHILELLRR